MENFNEIFENSRKASRKLNLVDGETINAILNSIADYAVAHCDDILAANRLDLDKMDPANPKYDRLKLTRDRIESIAEDTRNVARLDSPLGIILSETVRPNGMNIRKISVPFGVIGVVYEARPNVSFDVFALCLKAGSVTVLKGGSDAFHSNTAIVGMIKKVLQEFDIDTNTITLMPDGRDGTTALLGAVGLVDVIIPRGSSSLIEYVRNNSKVPVIETGAGICHTYFDAAGDTGKGRDIVFNAKTRRVSVCNALDSLVIHSSRLSDLSEICGDLASKSVIIYADPRAFDSLEGHYPASLLEKADENSFGTEFLDYKMSIKTVDSLDEAIEHITRYSSMHSEAIISEDTRTTAEFCRRIDAACVYANVSTAFTDGAQFGFGAEIGISTQKLHARGPMALPELTSYKYIITGNGQIRNS